MNQIFHAFLLTLFAGLATGSGSALALFAKRTNYKFLSFCLGFSAGVMIYVSMVEIFAEAQESLTGALGLKPGFVGGRRRVFRGYAAHRADRQAHPQL